MTARTISFVGQLDKLDTILPHKNRTSPRGRSTSLPNRFVDHQANRNSFIDDEFFSGITGFG